MKNPASSAAVFMLMICGMIRCSAVDKGSQVLAGYILDYATPVDPWLQARLEEVDRTLGSRFGMTSEHSAVGLLDLKTLRLAMLRPDRAEYAASLPKIGILLAYFHFHPAAPTQVDAGIRRELGLVAKASDNEMASKFSRELGLKQIQEVLGFYRLYDTNRGGIWMGKHYGRSDERIVDPVGQHSHSATVRQLLRYFLMLEQGILVSAEASKTMREVFLSPDIPHDPIKFVKGLAGRERQILRKWGSWEDWQHDAAVVTGGNRYYILVGLTHHAKGDEYLVELAAAVDDLLEKQ